MAEDFRPFENTPPEGIGGWCKFQLRVFLDFQVRTVLIDLKGFLLQIKGKVLDLGCGLSPYKHLFDPVNTEYIGLDIEKASLFGYRNTKVVHFEGQHIPFPDGSIDCIICTEVLEHVKNPKQLIDEIYRVLKPCGCGFVTVPWSARMHYLPYDYYRFTSVVLEDMFSKFICTINPRGTDITVIISKIIIVYLRNSQISNNILLWPFRLLIILVFLPFIVLCVLIGHLSLLYHWGSSNDPLGWTILLKKKGPV